MVRHRDQRGPGAAQRPRPSQRLAAQVRLRLSGPRRRPPTCTSQRSGCSRQVRSRKRPRSSAWSRDRPSRWPSADRSAPGGCVPCSGWSSCCGSPSRTSESRAGRDGQRRWRARSGRPRRRTARRPTRPCPRAPRARPCRPRRRRRRRKRVARPPRSSSADCDRRMRRTPSSLPGFCTIRTFTLASRPPRRLRRASCRSPCGCSAVTPTFFPAGRGPGSSRPGVGLARAGRALDGEGRSVERHRQAPRGLDPASLRAGAAAHRPPARLAAGGAAAGPRPPDRRRHRSMPCSATHSPRRSSAVLAARRSGSRRTERARSDGGRVLLGRAAGRWCVQPRRCSTTAGVPRRIGIAPGVGVHDRRPDLQVVLLGREAVAVDAGLVSPRRRRRTRDRPAARCFDRAPRRSGRPQVEEQPPDALVLAPMPDEELGEQPARVLLGGPPFLGHASRSGGRPRPATTICRSSGRGSAPDREVRAWDHSADLRSASSTRRPPASRAAAGWRRVVAVVALDPCQVVRARPFALAELEPRLERDDARAGVAQVDLAREAVERLEALDASSSRPTHGCPAARRGRGRRARRRAAGGRPRPRASRAGP